jgi:hypothetical protein
MHKNIYIYLLFLIKGDLTTVSHRGTGHKLILCPYVLSGLYDVYVCLFFNATQLREIIHMIQVL